MSQNVELIMELEDEVVFSRRSATEGDHETLDYIPGSALLGWAAAHLYKKFSMDESYLLFHSGKVRFYNGLPLIPGGGRAWPIPLCWHENKAGLPAREKGRLISNRIFNLMDPDSKVRKTEIDPKTKEVLQLRQLRGGYVSDSGQFFQPSRAYRMKTALDPDTATAAESQLFGYESLERGQKFVARISADDDVQPDLFQKLMEVFKGSIRIGRSRSAQYGRVKIEVSEKKMDNINRPKYKSKQLTLWLISDLALRDRFGSPTLFPDPSILGLPKGHLDPSKTFLRFRSYAPYNAFLKSREMERQVLVAGSVLTFMFDEDHEEETYLSILSNGIGFYRECGLGEVSINPKLIECGQPVFLIEPSNRPTEQVPRPNDPFIRFLERRATGRSLEKDSKDWAEKKAIDLALMYHSAREFNGVKSSEPFGPSRAQWRRVLDAANGKDSAGLKESLFVSENCVCKKEDEEWGIRINREKTFLSWLKDTIEESENEKLITSRNIQWLAKLAEDLRDKTSRSSIGSAG